jgi:CRP/FNR family transcriptional regulator, anaerobic regulatory protein
MPSAFTPISISTAEGSPQGVCTFCHNNLMGHVDASAQALGDQCCTQVEYAPGDAIFRQGQPGRHVFSVCKGLIRLEQRLPDGSSRCVRLLHAGCVFGMELLSGDPYHQSAFSVGRVRLCRIPADEINRLTQRNAALYQALMQQWQTALDEADFVIAQLSTGPARQRVARLLLHLCKEHGSDVCQAPPRDDMASLLGLTHETVSRTTAALKREGIVTELSGAFTCQLTRLQAISDDTEAAQPNEGSSQHLRP